MSLSLEKLTMKKLGLRKVKKFEITKLLIGPKSEVKKFEICKLKKKHFDHFGKILNIAPKNNSNVLISNFISHHDGHVKW